MMSSCHTSRAGFYLALFGLFCLLSGVAQEARAATEFLAPPGRATRPARITTGPDGNLWFTETGRFSIARLTSGGTLTEFPVPGAVSLNAITAGPDGALWFTDGGASYIGRITTAGVITTYPLISGNYAVDITSGPDSNLWFTEINTPVTAAASEQPPQRKAHSSTASSNAIVPDCPVPPPQASANSTAAGNLARMTTQGDVTTYGSYFGPGSITSGPDGNLWFVVGTSFLAGVKVAKVTTAGVQLGLFILGSTTFPNVQGGFITKGPDGKLWVTGLGFGNCGGNISDVVASITTAGQVSIFGAQALNATPGPIVTGPDGNLWFTYEPGGFASGGLTKITPSGTVTTFGISGNSLTSGLGGAVWVAATDSIMKVSTSGSVLSSFPLVAQDSMPTYITSGPDGALWFTDPYSQLVGHITTSGVGSTFKVGTLRLGNITTGPDGALWFATFGSGIGRISTTGTVTTFPSAISDGCSITSGPDGNLWSNTPSAIGRLSPQGIVTSFPRPKPSPDYACQIQSGTQIVPDPDGNLWFSSSYGAVDFITTSGAITEYPSGCTVPVGPAAAGPDGNLWFSTVACAGMGQGNIIKVTSAGNISSYPAGNLPGIANSVVAGNDGSLWFIGVGGIGRLTTSGLVTNVSAHISKPLNQLNLAPIFQLTTGSDGKLWFTEAASSLVGRISAIGGNGLTLNTSENSPVSGTVASFTDGTPAALATDLSAAINWGDGTISAGTVGGPMGGPFSVSGNHTYAAIGSYSVVVTVHDSVDNAEYDSAPGTVNVSDAPLGPGTIVFPAGNCVEGMRCQFALGSFTDADSKVTVALYTATVNWGDGTTSPGIVSTCGNEFCVSTSHVFSEEGSYNTNLAIADVEGSTLNTPGIAINVADAPLTAYSGTPASPHGVQFTEVIASFIDADPKGQLNDYTASIDWGDTTSSAGTITSNSAHGYDVTGTHTYSDPGPHTAKVTINDMGGSTASASSVVADDYQIMAVGKNFHVRLGQLFTVILASFTDTDPSPNPSDLSATIDWGDGSTPSAGVLISRGNGVFDVQGTHTYLKAFGRNVTVQMNHTAGASAIASDVVRLWPKIAP